MPSDSVHLWLSIDIGYSQITIYTQIVGAVSNPHVCLSVLSVCRGCGVKCAACRAAAPTKNEPSWVKQLGTLSFYHHPHYGNVKPPGPCQSLLVLLAIREPASLELEGGGEEGAVVFVWKRIKRNSDTEQGMKEEQLLFLSQTHVCWRKRDPPSLNWDSRWLRRYCAKSNPLTSEVVRETVGF